LGRVVSIDIADTTAGFVIMSKASRTSPESAGAAIAERADAPDSKGSINLRIEANTRQLIDDAAAGLGKTGAEFMIECARRQAIDVLLGQRLFVVNCDGYNNFINALDNPQAPGPELRALLRRPRNGLREQQ
jgi:uncharacterized protein (DUF1778 family)